jgi:transcription antitermination factor NusA-like protein
LKTPICSFDAKTGILCAGCEAKLEAGQLTPTEIDIAIKLTRLAEREQEVNTLSMISAARSGVDSVLFLRGSDISFLRSNPELLRKLEVEFGGAVWFVEAQATDRRFMENLFFPSKVLNMNFFWLPDGKKLTRVLIDRKDPKNAIKTARIQELAKELRNVELIIEYGA